MKVDWQMCQLLFRCVECFHIYWVPKDYTIAQAPLCPPNKWCLQVVSTPKCLPGERRGPTCLSSRARSWHKTSSCLKRQWAGGEGCTARDCATSSYRKSQQLQKLVGQGEGRLGGIIPQDTRGFAGRTSPGGLTEVGKSESDLFYCSVYPLSKIKQKVNLWAFNVCTAHIK